MSRNTSNEARAELQIARSHCAGVGSRAGFTLAELLAVMLIMVILLGMAASSFYGMGRGSRMRGAVSTLNTHLSLTRQYAITRTVPLDFVLLATAAGDHGYYIRRNDDQVQFRPTQYLPPSLHFYIAEEPNQNPVKLTSAGYVFTFMPDGSLKDLDDNLYIYIADETLTTPAGVYADGILFTISGLTGLVRITGD